MTVQGAISIINIDQVIDKDNCIAISDNEED